MHTFEITIQRRNGDGWPVVVEEQRGDGQMPSRGEGFLRIDETELRGLESTPKEYGLALGRALFGEGVEDAFTKALARTEDCLRLLLFIEDQEMRGLRWERLYAPVDNDWKQLATFQRALLSRYMPSLTDRRFQPIGRHDLRALIVVASPAPGNRFRLLNFDAQAAIDGVKAALGDIPYTVLADLPDAAGPATLAQLCEQITAEPYTLLHLVCHGSVKADGESVLFLHGDEGPESIHPVTGSELIERLSNLQGARGLPHFAFLSTCESASPGADKALGGVGQQLVTTLGMPAVVAMTDRVSIETANALAAKFYQQLAEHGEPDRALVEATAGLAGRDDVMVPVLFSRLGGRPLFSDSLDRPLTPTEIVAGLDRLGALLRERAPGLAADFSRHADLLRRTAQSAAEGLSAEAKAERAAALDEIEAICTETVELSFAALCLNKKPPEYDARCPFPGLQSFTADAREFFFGRDALVATLASRLNEQPFLAVIGASGSGKSSAVFAGLVPRLQQRDPTLRDLAFTPGEHPLENMRQALARLTTGGRAVVVVDQFEEAFTLCNDTSERHAFFEQLLALREHHPLVITMRSDFIVKCAEHNELNSLIGDRSEPVSPMSPEELRKAMEAQAASVGLRFEADLSSTILEDVRGEPGAMPLLQHALQELWAQRRGRWLRIAEYRRIGGIQQAIAHSANQIYNECDDTDKERLRSIFVRLTRLDDDESDGERRDTRQRVALNDLVSAGADPAPIRDLVNRLANGRLLVTGAGETTVEVAHEALIRSWPRLRDWLNEDRRLLLQREEIRRDARAWVESDEDESRLIGGKRLNDAVSLGELPRFAFNDLEARFVRASVAKRDRELAEEKERQQLALKQAQDLAAAQEKQAQIEREAAAAARNAAARIRRGAIAIAAVAVVALVSAVIAVRQWGAASEQRAEAIAAQATAVENERQADAARATAVENERQAIAARETAVAERDRADQNEQVAVRNANIAVGNGLDAGMQEAITSGDNSEAIGLGMVRVANFPDDPRAIRALSAAAYAPGVRTQMDVTQIDGYLDGNWERVMAVSPDGELAATGHFSGTVAIWDAADGSLVRQVTPNNSSVAALTFSPDGDYLVAGYRDGSIVFNGLSSSRAFPTTDGQILALAFSPDGALLAAGHRSGITLWNVASLSERGRLVLEGDPAWVTSLAFDPSGTRLLAGYSDGIPTLWDVNTQEVLVFLDGGESADLGQTAHFRAVASVAFSNDGRIAYTGSADSTIGIWDVGTPSSTAILFLNSHTAGVTSVSVSPDNRLLLSGSSDGTLRTWDLRTLGELLRLQADEEGVLGAAFLPSEQGMRAFSIGGLELPRVWDLFDGREARINLNFLINDIAVNTDGTGTIATTPNGAVLLRSDGSDPQEFVVPNTAIPGVVAITPAGKLAASTDISGTIYLWDTQSGANVGTLSGHEDLVSGMAFDPEGARLASIGYDATLRIWDLSDGSSAVSDLVAPYDEEIPAFPYALAWSPDGTELLLGSDEGAWIWDVEQQAIRRWFDQAYTTVYSAAWSPDGAYLAFGGANNTVYVVDTVSGKAYASYKHSGSVRDLAFTPDSTRLISGADDRRIIIWDVANRQMVETISLPEGAITSLVFNASLNSIVTASVDGTLRLWSLFSPDELLGWVEENRVIIEPDCRELANYGLCDPNATQEP